MPEFRHKPTKVRRLELSTQRIYKSACGRYKLVEVESKHFGRYWLVIRIAAHNGEYVVFRSNSRRDAELRLNLPRE